MDLEALIEAFNGVQKVIHCAALVSFHKLDFHRCMSINRRGTENVVNLCLKNKVKARYISSTAALGSSGNPISENSRWESGKEVSGYSVSKYSAEKKCFVEPLRAELLHCKSMPCIWSWQLAQKLINTAKSGKQRPAFLSVRRKCHGRC